MSKRTPEEEQAHFDMRQTESNAYWEEKSTSSLLQEVEDRMRGCAKPLCYACENTNQLVKVLRGRFDTEVLDKVLEEPKYARREYGSILENKPSKGRR